MSKVFSARFTIVGASPLPTPGDFDVYGDVVDQSLDGYSRSDVLSGDIFFDENMMTGLHSRYVVLSVVATGPSAYPGGNVNSVHLTSRYADVGDYDENGPAASEGAISRASAKGLSEIPAWSVQGVSESLTTRARNIDMRYVVDPNLGTGGGGELQRVDEIMITSTNVTNKSVTLTATPVDSNEVQVDVIGGPPQDNGVDFSVSSNVLSRDGMGLDGDIDVGDVLRIAYFY